MRRVILVLYVRSLIIFYHFNLPPTIIRNVNGYLKVSRTKPLFHCILIKLKMCLLVISTKLLDKRDHYTNLQYNN